MFRSSNPAFRNSAYAEPETWDQVQESPAATAPSAEASRPGTMTIQGTVNKSLFLMTICLATAMVGWNGFISWGWSPMAILVGGFLLAMVCIMAPKTSPVVAPLYAGTEGVFVGGVSALYAARFASTGDEGQVLLNTGLVFNAALLSFGILGGIVGRVRDEAAATRPAVSKSLDYSWTGDDVLLRHCIRCLSLWLIQSCQCVRPVKRRDD